MIDTVLTLLLLVLAFALARLYYERGKRRGWFECMRMVSEVAEEQAKREVLKQRAMVARMQAVDEREAAWERHAAEVAQWN